MDDTRVLALCSFLVMLAVFIVALFVAGCGNPVHLVMMDIETTPPGYCIWFDGFFMGRDFAAVQVFSDIIPNYIEIKRDGKTAARVLLEGISTLDGILFDFGAETAKP